ncbi:mechanosensitive ion channel family protein [Alteromonas sp. Cnat3-28]|uniref:mechanosensitive ion channel family protein n=1 Tax=unclassified Alteromonas TaxID=2614992 RepID=UPI001EF35506|nr:MULTISPECIES: mechanosensitive ion channel family protein [unclassified Alteromonas]MCG7642578.1 mechanosensitive ion channel family protein [Alteromonas sp. MmMcT2-2]MCG7646642.1 mechanosensitive ion channel family protein [Alteromonas sp. Cnat3-28]
MFSAQQILQPSILNKRTGLSFSQTDSEPFIQTLLQQSDEGGAISSLSSAQSLLSQLWENFVYRLPGLALGLVIMAAFILLAPHIAKVLVKPLTRTTTSPLLRSVIQRSVSLVLILLGIYLFLFLAGLTGFAIAVVSGTGVVGLILGFAFRDIAENFISSLLLTIQRPFRIGDIVQINDFTGIIQKVTARATTLVDFDGNHIQIPNATIYKGVIKNLTANPLMRGQFVIGVGYDADIQQAQQIAQEITSAQDNVLIDPEPQILIDELGPSTYNIKVYFWVDVEKTSVLKMASVLMRKITQAFLEANISMPDDARERIFPEGMDIYHASEKDASSANSSENVANELSESTTEQKNVKSFDSEQNSGEATENRNERSSAKGAGTTRPQESKVNDDVSSEAHEIREQARKSRDPEAGENIL